MSKEQHIVSSFDRDLEGLQAMLMRMGGLVEKALEDALTALESFDLKLAEKIIASDNAIDVLDEQIAMEAARIIAQRAPHASDLRIVLAVMRAGASLERIGDYAKNIAKRTSILSESRRIEGMSGTARRMSTLVSKMIDEALGALIRRDHDAAEAVRNRDMDVDQIYNTMFRALLTYMIEDPANITPCMHYHFIAKNIERAGDHATGIAEQAIYLATGTLPDDDRPKADLPETGNQAS